MTTTTSTTTREEIKAEFIQRAKEDFQDAHEWLIETLTEQYKDNPAANRSLGNLKRSKNFNTIVNFI